MINERKMDYLLKIAETQSITIAAKELYLSQPALSQLITSLEKTYETKIFEYKSGKLVPTFTGEIILESFQRHKCLENSLQRTLEDVRESKTGRISIGISSGRAPMFLSIILPDFVKKYPNIQLLINTRSHEGFESMVSTGNLDLAFVMDKADVPKDIRQSLIYTPLFDYYCLLAAPPNHPIARIAEEIPDWRHREAVNLENFQDEPFIKTIILDRHRSWDDAIYSPYDFNPAKTILLTDEASAFDLVQAGLGFALLQDYVAFSHQKGSFFRLERDNSKATLCAILRKEAYISESMRYFISLVQLHTEKGTFFRFK